MSLNWNLTKIEDHEERCFNEITTGPNKGKFKLDATTESLIWTTMLVGMGEITEKNWEEFFIRMRTFELILDYDDNRCITPADVRNHIGLTTNVSKESRTQFMKKVESSVKRYHLDYFLKQEKKDAETSERQNGTTG